MYPERLWGAGSHPAPCSRQNAQSRRIAARGLSVFERVCLSWISGHRLPRSRIPGFWVEVVRWILVWRWEIAIRMIRAGPTAVTLAASDRSGPRVARVTPLFPRPPPVDDRPGSRRRRREWIGAPPLGPARSYSPGGASPSASSVTARVLRLTPRAWSARQRVPAHFGEIVRDELGLTVTGAAEALGVTRKPL
jgi:hypothetical protein